jgi:RimJ/RimL family protein N-acetyltransferase
MTMDPTEELLVDDDARITAWIDEHMGAPVPSAAKTAIGFTRCGELVAGVTFDNVTDNNIFAHLVSVSPTGVPLELLSACYLYVFEQLGVERVSLLMRADNERVLRFVEKWGATFEARLVRGCKACDQLIYVVWRSAALDAKLIPAGRT